MNAVALTPERRRARRRAAWRRRRLVLLLMSPWIVGFAVFFAYPLISNAYLSFTHYDLLSHPRWIGTSNYEFLFEKDPSIWPAVKNTLWLVAIMVPLQVVFAIGVAMALQRARRGVGFFRTVFYLPRMTPVVATAAIFFLLLNGNTGAVNQFLGVFGIEGPQWLVDPTWIKPSIVLMQLWAVSGTMVIFLAALKNVPRELYEVASLDGAGPVRRFFSITLPMISGAMFFNVIVLTIAAFQVFDSAYLLFWRDESNASPEAALFYAVYLFQQAFRQFNFGFAAAMAWLLFVILLLLTLIQVKIGNRFVYYEGGR